MSNDGPKLGRRGDPRMHRAVAARLENPKLTLTEALKIGGFDVSRNEDAHGVTVSQRKNQLSRRLRLVRQGQTGVNHVSEFSERTRVEINNQHSCDVYDKAENEEDTKGREKSFCRSSIDIGSTTSDEDNSEAAHRCQDGSPNSSLHKKDMRQPHSASNEDSSKQVFTKSHTKLIHEVMQQRSCSAAPKNVSKTNSDVICILENLKNNRSSQTDLGDGLLGGTIHNLHKALNLHCGQGVLSQQKKVSIDIAALAGGMAGMNQHALQALLAGRLKSRGDMAQASTESDAKELMQQEGREDIYKSCVRQQKVLNEYLIKTYYQKGAPNSMVLSNQGQFLVNNCLSSQVSSLSNDKNVESRPDPNLANGALQAQIREGMKTNLMKRQAQDYGCNKKRPKTDSTLSAATFDNQVQNTSDLRIQLVLTSHQTENASLLQRLMSQAGFSAEELMQHSPIYIEIAARAAKQELERVERLKDTISGAGGLYNLSCASTKDQKASSNTTEDQSNVTNECVLGGRHLHRLMGKCGHRAIIHRPHDGNPHIDFIVNDRVECYQELSPESADSNGETLWPSRYECKELHCNDEHREEHSRSSAQCKTRLPDQIPREFDISILEEWDTDPFESLGDQTLLGLIELGKTSGKKK